MPVVLTRWRGGLLLGGIQQLQCFTSATNGRFSHVIGMAEPGHLTRHATQAKARPRRIIRHFQAAIVKAETLARAILQVQFTIIACLQRVTRYALRRVRVEKARLVKIGAWNSISHTAYMGRCDGGGKPNLSISYRTPQVKCWNRTRAAHKQGQHDRGGN